MESLIVLLGPLLLKALGGLAVIAALAAAYFGIKHKGALQERTKQEEVKQKVQFQVGKAASKDVEIDNKVQVEVQKIEEANKPVIAADDTKFHF